MGVEPIFKTLTFHLDQKANFAIFRGINGKFRDIAHTAINTCLRSVSTTYYVVPIGPVLLKPSC